MDRQRPSMATRMRLARRVTDALLPQDDDVTLVAVEPTPTLTQVDGPAPARADFIVGVLDLRIRILLLPNQSREILDTAVIATTVDHILYVNPETIAVLVVCDDELLSARVFEALPSPAGEGFSKATAGVREVLAAYLTTLRPEWPPPPTLDTTTRLSFDSAVRSAATRALDERRASRTTIEQRRRARVELDQSDLEWLVAICQSMLLGGEQEIDKLYATTLRPFDD